MLRKWEDLPKMMQTEAVRPYYEYLNKRRGSLLLKRMFDIVVSTVLLNPGIADFGDFICYDRSRFKGWCVLQTGESDAIWTGVPYFQVPHNGG